MHTHTHQPLHEPWSSHVTVGASLLLEKVTHVSDGRSESRPSSASSLYDRFNQAEVDAALHQTTADILLVRLKSKV